MSSINQLSEAAAVSPGMQVPVYDAGNGQPRKISLLQLLAWIEDSRDAAATGPVALANYSVAELPSAMAHPAAVVYCANGDAGIACLAVSDGATWRRVALGAAVSPT